MPNSILDADPPAQQCGALHDIDEGDSLDELDARVLAHLAGLAGPRHIAAASNRELGAALGIHGTTARRALGRLIDTGQLELVTRGANGRYRSRYRLTSRPAAA